MLGKVESRTTMFLGAAASSFKPTSFPAWDKFIEMVYHSLVENALSDVMEGRNGRRSSDLRRELCSRRS